jgi:hypothetical protein
MEWESVAPIGAAEKNFPIKALFSLKFFTFSGIFWYFKRKIDLSVKKLREMNYFTPNNENEAK